MKKILLMILILMTALLIFAGCKKDADEKLNNSDVKSSDMMHKELESPNLVHVERTPVVQKIG